ncbi:uncharacterized protein LOC106712073 [Papilio machaon]|uniref:uncharacterized protein LOC106712073 n=1 Tax=Papilio machaon TaxID=76193 RepID=UPI001E665B34|nr:uncharacterized protein LOC106712073 [Papilio machaon]XP_045537738.1 uncharacterized protein LOC106712073 [Papilio machaon]
MKKQVAVMPSLEVLIERLPQAVLDSAIGPVRVLQKMPKSDKSIQPSLKLKSSVKTKLMQNVAKKKMPSLQVTLERLPKDLMTSLLAEKKKYTVQEKRKVGRPKKIRDTQFKNSPPMFDFISV